MRGLSRRTLAPVLALLGAWSGSAPAKVPEKVTPDLAKLADGKGALLFNRALAVGTEDGRRVARLDARAGDGGALLEGIRLGEGVIEVDLKGRDLAQRSFLGIAFHVVDWTTFDAVHFRPFNFRAADPERRARAVQYVSHPAWTWPRLREERPGRFEKAVDPPPDPDAWFHARIVLAGSRVEVFVNGAAVPSLSVEDLSPQKSGGVALFAGNGSDGAFAGLTITATSPPGPVPESSQNVFQASATGNLERVRRLVEADATSVGARNPGDLTPRHLAARYGQRGVAEYLLAKGADPNAVARHSGTPLDLAAESGQPAFSAWLQARGARFTPVRFDVAPLSKNVRRLAFPWGMRNNVVVLSGPDGAVVVDSGFSARAVDDLKREIASTAKGGVRYLVSSHGHGDHVAGNALAPSPGAVLTASSLAAGSAGPAVARETKPLEGRSGRTLPAPYALRAAGTVLRLIPRPGLHSEEDVIVWIPAESVVAMGDLLLSESVPAVEDVAGYLAFLEDVLDVFPEDTTFVGGHGRELDAAGVRAYRDDLIAMLGIVRTQLAAGRTAEQMVRDDVLKTFKPKYSLLAFLTPDAFIPRAAALAAGSPK